jgi:hypothetical protein
LKRKKLSFNFFFSNNKLLSDKKLFDYLVPVAETILEKLYKKKPAPVIIKLLKNQ